MKHWRMGKPLPSSFAPSNRTAPLTTRELKRLQQKAKRKAVNRKREKRDER